MFICFCGPIQPVKIANWFSFLNARPTEIVEWWLKLDNQPWITNQMRHLVVTWKYFTEVFLLLLYIKKD